MPVGCRQLSNHQPMLPFALHALLNIATPALALNIIPRVPLKFLTQRNDVANGWTSLVGNSIDHTECLQAPAAA